MEESRLNELLIEVLEDESIRYGYNFPNVVYICILLDRHLSQKEIDYIRTEWRAFFYNPSAYTGVKYLVNCDLNDLESNGKESE